ncbi:MAG: PQQ-binding-like beta-propeller repeat protein [Planctomycetia bacterium]|nr:PQQ-binding-like beta-propeller repeat protein [Planctomycetia bacterium]
MKYFCPLFLVCCLFLLSPIHAAEPWPEYLGPQGLGHAVQLENKDIPLEWSESKNVLWKSSVPGKGWSSPVVGDNEIWFTSASEDGKKRFLLCYDLLTGKKTQDILLYNVEKVEKCHRTNSYASPTPVIDSERVYVHFGTIGTAAIDRKTGKKIWDRTDLRWEPIQGFGASPTLWKNLLILTCDGGDVQFLIAMDKDTGKTVWKTNRSVPFTDEKPVFRKGYCSSTVLNYEGVDYLVSSSSKAAYAYDPATGKELWRFIFPKFSETSTMRPRLWKNKIIVNSGFPKATLYALDITKRGEIDSKDFYWQNGQNFHPVPVPVLVDGYLYGTDGKGIVFCVSAENGKTVWRKRVGGEFWTSTIYQNGRIYVFDTESKTYVIAADPKECRILATNTLADGCMATPAFLGDSVIIRTKTALYRIGAPQFAGKK